MLAILGELCWLEFFKTIYLESSNVRFGLFFQNPVTNSNGIKVPQGCPEKLRGSGQRVKVGPQRQGGFHSESQLHRSCKLKTKLNYEAMNKDLNKDLHTL